MTLDIIVVGAGIGGLSAAVSLRQAGHAVRIYEKSQFAAEIGAALALAPNGVTVLASLGFDFERALACRLNAWETVDGLSLKQITSASMKDAERVYGAPLMSIHRVDLHKELLRLAQEDAGQLPGRKVELNLASPVVAVDTVAGSVTLEDGSVQKGDLVVGADGLHSVVRRETLGLEKGVQASGMSAFRFLASTEKLNSDPQLAKLLEWKIKGGTLLVDTEDNVNERHMVWYDCHGGAVQNVAGIHPTREEDAHEDVDFKASMLKEFGHFHPDVRKMLSVSENVKCWPLYLHDPLQQWTFDKVILVGDAAHPMLPFGGQGSNQAIEDGGALGCMLLGVQNPADIPERLRKFELVRRNRASRVQILSKVRSGKEKEVEQELRNYRDSDTANVPQTFPERLKHDYGYNVLAESKKVLHAY